MGATHTLDFLEHIKRKEERIMHHHLSNLRHPQWGSIVGYEADVRVAILEDELEESDSKKLQELISKVDEEFDDTSSDSMNTFMFKITVLQKNFITT